MKRWSAAALTASALALASIAGYEGYRGTSYNDGAGVTTVGFGTARVAPGTTTDPVRAVQQLARDADKTAQGIQRCLGEVLLYQWEFDSYVSLAYNIGVGAFCRSTIVKRLKTTPPGYAGACKAILPFNRAGGQVMPGLVKRRQKEYTNCMRTE